MVPTSNPRVFPSTTSTMASGMAGGGMTQPGMGLREYFAATAPISLADAMLIYTVSSWQALTEDQLRFSLFSAWAQLRFEYADRMIEAMAPKS